MNPIALKVRCIERVSRNSGQGHFKIQPDPPCFKIIVLPASKRPDPLGSTFYAIPILIKGLPQCGSVVILLVLRVIKPATSGRSTRYEMDLPFCAQGLADALTLEWVEAKGFVLR